jgi:type IV fimbrial biogenesis protein FimT
MRNTPSRHAAPMRHHRSGRRIRGFTLIETMVVVMIAAVLAMLAAPSFQSAYLSNRLTGFANEFVASTQLARSEAIKRNAVVRLCRSADGATCATSGTWQQGWIVFGDTNNNSAVDSGETIFRKQEALSPDYHVTSTSGTYNLAFQAIGAGSDSATLQFCRATPSPGNQERTITLGPTGRTVVTTTRTGICS